MYCQVTVSLLYSTYCTKERHLEAKRHSFGTNALYIHESCWNNNLAKYGYHSKEVWSKTFGAGLKLNIKRTVFSKALKTRRKNYKIETRAYFFTIRCILREPGGLGLAKSIVSWKWPFCNTIHFKQHIFDKLEVRPIFNIYKSEFYQTLTKNSVISSSSHGYMICCLILGSH